MRSFSGPARVRFGGFATVVAIGLALASAQPAVAVLGGTGASISSAPWQAEVAVFNGVTLGDCGGVLVGESQVLTDAHCVVNPATGHPLATMDIRAGVGTANAVMTEPTEQMREVSAVHIDPAYVFNTLSVTADDLAIVEVSKPFTLGATDEPISIVSSGTEFPVGTSVALNGYGEQETSGPIGPLNTLDTKLLADSACGGVAGGPFLCAQTSTGSTCFADSGSGLTLSGATVIGLVDRLEQSSAEACEADAVDTFVNLAAPAIHEFVASVVTTTTTTTTSTTTTTTTTAEHPVAKSSVSSPTTKLSFSAGDAIVKLDCSGTATCKGKLTLTAVKIVEVKGKKRKETVTIGTESFSVAGGRTAKIKIKLSSYARAQIKSTHGHLKASLSILGLETEPTHKRTEAVTIS